MLRYRCIRRAELKAVAIRLSGIMLSLYHFRICLKAKSLHIGKFSFTSYFLYVKMLSCSDLNLLK